ncbi:MAG TPA: hypothetical protein VFR70_07010 [Flavobacterium sp.]|nr:hypothetical protein [Flavobacterium sp.]
MKTFIPASLLSIFLLASCFEKRTSAGEEAYEYWTGTEPENDIKILNGRYWQSSHWTKEYELYLEMQTSPKLVQEFIRQNKLKVKTSTELNLPDNAPNWFKPRIGLKVYEPSGFSQGSIYFVDEKTGYIMFYEIQL